jgi:hypothetical protein
MAASELLRFLAVSVVVIVTPGPDTALTIRSTLAGGRRAGIRHRLGCCHRSGILDLGSQRRNHRTPERLGSGLLGAPHGRRAVPDVVGFPRAVDRLARRSTAAGRAPAQCALGLGSAFAQGLLSNLGNPKMVAFFRKPAAAVQGSGGCSPWRPS